MQDNDSFKRCIEYNSRRDRNKTFGAVCKFAERFFDTWTSCNGAHPFGWLYSSSFVGSTRLSIYGLNHSMSSSSKSSPLGIGRILLQLAALVVILSVSFQIYSFRFVRFEPRRPAPLMEAHSRHAKVSTCSLYAGYVLFLMLLMS